MAAAANGVVVQGLAEFRASLRAAQGRYPTELTAALKKAGTPVLVGAASRAPHRTGRLAASYRVSVRGLRASIVSSAPYSGGAEWGRFGKWKGFAGAPPRIVWPAIEAATPAIQAIILEELRGLVTVNGWFR